MFRKTLITLASAAVLATTFASPSFAGMGGGGENPNDGRPSATAYSSNGSITSRGNADGSRTITKRDRKGKVVKVRVVPKPAKKPKAKKPKGRAWASSVDTRTGQRTSAFDNGNRTRTVITFGPFGFGIRISR